MYTILAKKKEKKNQIDVTHRCFDLCMCRHKRLKSEAGLGVQSGGPVLLSHPNFRYFYYYILGFVCENYEERSPQNCVIQLARDYKKLKFDFGVPRILA